MEIVFWILLCILAYIGGIEIFGRLFFGFRPPKKAAKGFLVVRLGKDSAIMREQMEYYLSWIEWNGPGHPVIFLRDEGDDSAADMFSRFLGDLPGVELATHRQLSGIIDRE